MIMSPFVRIVTVKFPAFLLWGAKMREKYRSWDWKTLLPSVWKFYSQIENFSYLILSCVYAFTNCFGIFMENKRNCALLYRLKPHNYYIKATRLCVSDLCVCMK